MDEWEETIEYLIDSLSKHRSAAYMDAQDQDYWDNLYNDWQEHFMYLINMLDNKE